MDTEMKFAWIPPGSFLMGGNDVPENPQHRVTITKGFWMGIVPVTQTQWQAVMGYNPSSFRGDDRPVELVSWHDCQAFCEKMKQLTSKPIRLPTEAEWECACRAGSTSDWWNGGNSAALKNIGWFHDNSNKQTQPVGELAPNPWGLFDTHGNVCEWCQDFRSNLTSIDQADPFASTAPFLSHLRMVRGGSWAHDRSEGRSAWRGDSDASKRDSRVGLRVCFSTDSESDPATRDRY